MNAIGSAAWLVSVLLVCGFLIACMATLAVAISPWLLLEAAVDAAFKRAVMKH